jgi:Zn-dependent protease
MILSKRIVFIKLNMTLFSSLDNFLFWIIVAIPSIIIASTIHEYAHAYIAYRLGDPTAKAEGRLTLNPLKHIDPIGAISMVLFRFGWSKPVPINEYNFEKREFYTGLTAIAGPISNILLALLTGLINFLIKDYNLVLIEYLLYIFATINIALAVFNLLPIPPLDGHKIVRAILPKSLRYYWEKLEKFSIILILLILLPISPISTLTRTFISTSLDGALRLLGF